MLEKINDLTNKFKNITVIKNIHIEVKDKGRGCVLFVWPELNQSQIVLRTKNKNKEVIQQIVDKYQNKPSKQELIFEEMILKGIYSEEEVTIKICSLEH